MCFIYMLQHISSPTCIFSTVKRFKVITSGRPEPRFWVHLAKKSPFGSHKVKLMLYITSLYKKSSIYIWSTNCGLYLENGLNILQFNPLLGQDKDNPSLAFSSTTLSKVIHYCQHNNFYGIMVFISLVLLNAVLFPMLQGVSL